MSNFNAIPRPATVLVTGDQASIIRRRETQGDVFRRDVMPKHLQQPGAADRLVPLRESGPAVLPEPVEEIGSD